MTDLLRQLQTSIGSAYAVERELGGGGMSRVFVATETALGRRVVIKVLTPELAQGLSAERFAREIKVAAALQEPHIVPVLAAGDAEGLPYYTMPYVEGESLRARLLRGEVPVGDAVGILRDVALALEYAHARGIVHRDIKPENVLLSGRTAVVADFGIAKALSAARTQGPETPSGTLTSVGQSLGTPAYMAPEQATGDAIDHRADLYAWGVMAYELLAGRHPFADKASAAQLMAAQVMEKPVPLVDRKPGLAPPIAALVMQCLEKEPGERPPSATEVVHALDGASTPSSASARPATVAAAATQGGGTTSASAATPPRRPIPALPISLGVVALSVAAVFFVTRSKGAERPAAPAAAVAPDTARGAIAVLPFENLGDSSEAYFADGLTDAVRTKLIGLPGVRVIARGSSNQYRATTKSPAVIAKELGVRYLLTGAVRFAKGGRAARVQVTPELVEVSSAGQPESRWGEPFDAEVKDVFKVQGDIAGKVATAMQVALGGAAQAQLQQAATQDAAAYDAYLRGEAAWNFGASNDPRSLRRARALFEQAIQHDPKMADAWAELSIVLASLYSNGRPQPELGRRAREAAQRALTLDPNSANAHLAMSNWYRTVPQDYPAALADIETARRSAPNDITLLNAAATMKEELGRLEESVRDRQAVLALDPRSAGRWSSLATTYLRLRRYDEARQAADRAIALAPTALNSQQTRLLAELGLGRLDSARAVVARAASDVPLATMIAYNAMYWDLGWTLDVEQERLLLRMGPDAFDDLRYVWAIVRAQQYHWRGDAASAKAWGDSAARDLVEQMRQAPQDEQLPVINGLALAYAGRKAEAIASAQRGIAMHPLDRGGGIIASPYFQYLLARIYLLTGEPDKAIDTLDQVLRLPFFVSGAWLRIDPTWKALRGNPRFERMVAGA